MKLLMLPLLVCILSAHAEDKAPDLSELKKQVETIVLRHYPDAKVSLENDTVRFAFKTARFMIQRALKTGELQKAVEETGPEKGGILGEIRFVRGKYMGAAVLPQTFRTEHYETYGMAPHSEKHDGHLHTRITYPSDVKEKFLTELVALLKDFEKYLPQK